jgi:hypothetical protein
MYRSHCDLFDSQLSMRMGFKAGNAENYDGLVVELADTPDSESGAARRVGSSPTEATEEL